jgi:hypothetical protein
MGLGCGGTRKRKPLSLSNPIDDVLRWAKLAHFFPFFEHYGPSLSCEERFFYFFICILVVCKNFPSFKKS